MRKFLRFKKMRKFYILKKWVNLHWPYCIDQKISISKISDLGSFLERHIYCTCIYIFVHQLLVAVFSRIILTYHTDHRQGCRPGKSRDHPATLISHRGCFFIQSKNTTDKGMQTSGGTTDHTRRTDFCIKLELFKFMQQQM